MRIVFIIATVIAMCTAQIGVREVRSCSVPVFRYALERWIPDTYKGIVIFKDEMTKDEQTLFDQLKNNSRDPDFPLNLQIRAVNSVVVSEEKLKGVLKGDLPEQLPVITLWYPDGMGKTAPFFTARFDPAVVDTISHSPKREELAKRLISKDAAVWIFLESGNLEKDQQAEAFLRKELDAATIRLAGSPKHAIPGYEGKVLSYEFSILPLTQTDPMENFFLEMLLGTELDLHEHRDKPMVFSVFGRGRLLGALFGEYISKKNIQGAVSFMTGACSCEVKALNPGTDLLIAAPWNRAVSEIYSSKEALPELTGVMPESPDSEMRSYADAKDTRKRVNLLLIYGLALIGMLVLVGLLSLIVLRRTRRN